MTVLEDVPVLDFPLQLLIGMVAALIFHRVCVVACCERDDHPRCCFAVPTPTA